MKVGVIGATGVVGGTILRVLEERNVPVDELLGVRIARARQRRARFAARRARRGRDDASASSPTGRTSRSSRRATTRAPRWRRALADAGIIVIDNSSTFRMDPRLSAGRAGSEPAVDPSRAIASSRSAIARRSCCASRSRRSNARSACAACASRPIRPSAAPAAPGSRRWPTRKPAEAPNGTFAAPILRNVVPQVGSFDGVGDNGEEDKVAAETRKMLRPSGPARRGDERARSGSPRAQRSRLLRNRAADDASRSSRDAFGRRRASCFTTAASSRRSTSRTPTSCTSRGCVPRRTRTTRRFMMWIVGDQLRKGAATNGVQILELLIEQGRFAEAASRR